MNPDPMSSSVRKLSYRCPQRPKSFKKKGHVQRTMRAVHSNIRPYCCPLCRKCFAQGYDLASHQLRVHGRKKKPGVVEVRGKEVRGESSLPPPDSAWEPEPPSNDQPTETQTGRASSQRLRNLRVKSTRNSKAKTKANTPKQRETSIKKSDCQRTFGNPESLKAHQCIRVVVGPPLYSCSTCRVTFKRYTTLKNSKAVPCSYCQFSFTEERYLRKHVKRHHPDEHVSQATGLGSGLIQSEQKAGEVHLCLQCGQSYEHVQSFKAHRCFQSDAAKLHLCNDCGKGFSCFYSLKQHQRIHTGEKPYRCSYCEKCFSHSGHLNVHVRIHTGEKSFLCTECGESFRQSGDLKRHERKHTGNVLKAQVLTPWQPCLPTSYGY
uniref:C2H2-type domain-containing protein n=1 Tax=Oncorhynchus tshawytscha TaxID=74940 RepID=A0A8C8GK04_ONCTS